MPKDLSYNLLPYVKSFVCYDLFAFNIRTVLFAEEIMQVFLTSFCLLIALQKNNWPIVDNDLIIFAKAGLVRAQRIGIR